MKQKSVSFICQNCSYQDSKWQGQCPNCKSWNSFVQNETSNLKPSASKSNVSKDIIKAQSIDEIEIIDGNNRFSSGIEEFDRVLGGGIVRQSVILLGGPPGIGKSTLLLQLSSSMNKKILYISGEESSSQIKMRANRLKLSNMSDIDLLCSSNLDDIMKSISKKKYDFVVIDSIQTIYSYDIDSSPGSVSQIKYTSSELANFAKHKDTTLLLIAHITKDGLIAGPKVLEHLVDTVIYFEEGKDELRYIVTSKNRFGPSGEIGFFLMMSEGLVQIKNPENYFFSHEKNTSSIGVMSTLAYEGSRTLPIEIQSLVSQNNGGLKTYADKIDTRRIIRICAIIQNQIGLSFIDNDVFINTGGGLKIDDTGADLSIALAIYSSKILKELPSLYCSVGELTLSGEIRTVKQLKKRIQSGFDLGYSVIIGPPLSKSENTSPIQINNNLKYLPVKTLKEAINIINKLS